MIKRYSMGLVFGALLAATASAGEPTARMAEPPKAQTLAQPANGTLTPLSQDDLAAVSAGQSPAAIALTNQNLTAVNSGNLVTAQNITTGQVSFSSGAFQGFTGIGNFVINTGNNNNLQGSLSVTVIPLQ